MTANTEISARAMLFDLDGVLVDSILAVELAWRDWATERGFDADAVIAVVHGRRAADTVRAVAPHLDLDREVAWLSRRESTESRGLLPIPGASELIALLPPRQWAVVTSGTREVATFRLGVGGIPLPEILVSANDVSRGKPDPEGYLKAAKSLEFSPSECVVIEDAPAGLEAARAAGMRSVGIASTFQADALTGATLVLQSLQELQVQVGSDGVLTLRERT